MLLLCGVNVMATNWTDVVVEKPDSYIEWNDTIFLNDSRAVAWVASVSNGINGADSSTFLGKTLFLTRDVNMSEHEFSKFISTFDGVFDGNNHSITSMVDSSCSFCRVNRGEIKNLKRNGGIVGQWIERYSYRSCAMFAVENYGKVRNCSATYTELSYISSIAITVGCMVANNYGVVDGCKIAGKWIVSGNIPENSCFGGIVARNYGVVKNCVNKAIIDGYCYATGGIVAENQGEIFNCSNVGVVRGGATYSGGLVGIMIGEDAELKNSYSLGKQDGNGLVGMMKSGAVYNCYATTSKSFFGEDSYTDQNSYIYACIDSVSAIPTGCYGFQGNGRKCILVDKIYDTFDMPTALNSWVDMQPSEGLAKWKLDTEYENEGYPMLVIPEYVEEKEYEKPTLRWVDVVKERPETYVENGNDIYILDNRSLAWLISVMNGLNGQQQNNLFGKNIMLMSDINMGKYKWTPIKNFQATLDGTGKNIKGLFVEDTTINAGFVVTNNGKIQDVNFKDASMYVYTKSNVLAGMVAANNNGEIYNVKCNGQIHLDGVSENCNALYLGGLAGLNNGTISTCKSQGSVYLDYWDFKDHLTAENYVGGIVGENLGIVDACINEAEVTGYCYASGGVAGCIEGNKAKVINCANRGFVSMSGSPSPSYGGGLVGYMKGPGILANSYNTGYVDVMSVVGYQKAGTISNCYKTCTQTIMSEDGNPSYNYIYSCKDSVDVLGMETSQFKKDGTSFTLTNSVYGTTDFVEALNSWVDNQNSSSYMKWTTDKKKENKGYPILRVSYKKDTTFYVCPDIDYYGNIFTSADDSTTKSILWNDTLYEKVKIILNANFDDITIKRKDSFYVGEIVTLSLIPSCTNTVWKLDDGTIRYGSTVAIPVDITYKNGHVVKVSMTQNGCSHQMFDTLKAAKTGYDTVLYVCPETVYEGNNIFTIEDNGSVQTLNWTDSTTIVAKIVVKADYNKIHYTAPEFFCANEMLTISMSGASNYLWIVNSDTVKTDDYIFREPTFRKFISSEDDGFVLEAIATLNGCERRIVDTLTPKHSEIIEMIGWGDVLAIANPDTMYESYQWYFNGERQEYETNQYLYCPKGLQPGAYSARAYRWDGSYETYCPLFITKPAVKSLTQKVSVYPNPSTASDEVHIELQNIEESQIASIMVSDNTGKFVYQVNELSQFDVSSLSTGWYILYIQLQNDDVYSTKFSIIK